MTLAELGLDLDPELPTAGLSGGQAARVALAALLLSRFDVVLLDEPTNDLDLDGLARLESFVRGLRGGVVLVSHDREFLARCVTTVVELDLAQDSVRVYDGGYDAFLEERQVARRHAREAYEQFADTKADLVSRARTQREWSSQGVRNAMRKSPDNDKIRRKASVESSEKQGQKVRQMESRIARLEEVEEPRKEWQLAFTIGQAPRSSAVVATLREATVTRGRFTLGPVSLQVDGGDRIGITGPNGAGKSTLLGLILGRIAPDAGDASPGRSVQVGEIDQARAALRGDAPSPSRSRSRCRTCRPPRSARCSRSSGCAPTTSRVPSTASRPGSGRARVSRSCKRAASTCSCSTSRPTTWTCPPSSSSSRRSTPTTARSCS